MKNTDENSIINNGIKLKQICHKYNVQFILNDNINLAKIVDADGVHLGKQDWQYEDARKILGNDKIIGISCYDSIDRAMEFAEKGADYVAFGAFFKSNTKENTTIASTEILKLWSSCSKTPCVAIGGIDQNNCNEIVDSGADFIAVISSIWNNEKGEVNAILDLSKATT